MTHQLMDPLCKGLPRPLLEPLHHHSLNIFVWPKTMALSAFLSTVESPSIHSSTVESSETFAPSRESILTCSWRVLPWCTIMSIPMWPQCSGLAALHALEGAGPSPTQPEPITVWLSCVYSLPANQGWKDAKLITAYIIILYSQTKFEYISTNNIQGKQEFICNMYPIKIHDLWTILILCTFNKMHEKKKFMPSGKAGLVLDQYGWKLAFSGQF